MERVVGTNKANLYLWKFWLLLWPICWERRVCNGLTSVPNLFFLRNLPLQTHTHTQLLATWASVSATGSHSLLSHHALGQQTWLSGDLWFISIGSSHLSISVELLFSTSVSILVVSHLFGLILFGSALASIDWHQYPVQICAWHSVPAGSFHHCFKVLFMDLNRHF